MLDCLPHDLLIAKLHAYGIKKGSLNLLLSYLKNRKQRARLNNTYNAWIHILFGVPQWSLLDPLLFNIISCGLFLLLPDIPEANYADGNTSYCTCLKILDVQIKSENAAKTLLEWLRDTKIKAYKGFRIKIGNEAANKSKCLGLK